MIVVDPRDGFAHGYVFYRMSSGGKVGLGPAAQPGRACARCERNALLFCEGCGECLCQPCWNKHSHTASGNGFEPGPE
jgi:hypothetical protein